MKYLLYLGFVCLGMQTLCAQSETDDQKLPPGPWPSRAPSMSTWTVKIDEQRGSSSNNAAAPNDASANKDAGPQQMLTVIKTWPVFHETAIDFKGLKWEKWFANGLEVAVVPGTGQTIISNSAVKDSFLFQDYSKSDFSDLDWLSADNYKEKGDCDGVPSFIFEGKMVTNPNGAPTLLKESIKTSQGSPSSTKLNLEGYTAHVFTVRAYLDCKSLLPLKLEYGDETRTYTFGQAPTFRQVLPITITNAIAESAKEKAAAEAKPDRPF